jgi:hypothetical protein
MAALSADSAGGVAMSQTIYVNATSEHALFLCLFITTSGGW